jgi:Xaa-Pro aminopeptidase
VLSDAVVAAVASVYRAKEDYESAKAKKTADVDQLATVLAAERKSEREATRALENHVREHGCDKNRSSAG